MKLKYYLRGLGIGLIVTTLILTISNHQRNTTSANDHNQTETTGSVLAYTTQAATQENSTEQADNQNDKESADAQKDSTESGTKQADGSNKEDASSNTTAEKSTESNKTTDLSGQNGDSVTVTIKDAYYSAIAADILYKEGIIDDKTEFNSYLSTSGYATKIKDGEYTLKKGDSYENIAKIITRTK